MAYTQTKTVYDHYSNNENLQEVKSLLKAINSLLIILQLRGVKDIQYFHPFLTLILPQVHDASSLNRIAPLDSKNIEELLKKNKENQEQLASKFKNLPPVKNSKTASFFTTLMNEKDKETFFEELKKEELKKEESEEKIAQKTKQNRTKTTKIKEKKDSLSPIPENHSITKPPPPPIAENKKHTELEKAFIAINNFDLSIASQILKELKKKISTLSPKDQYEFRLASFHFKYQEALFSLKKGNFNHALDLLYKGYLVSNQISSRIDRDKTTEPELLEQIKDHLKDYKEDLISKISEAKNKEKQEVIKKAKILMDWLKKREEIINKPGYKKFL